MLDKLYGLQQLRIRINILYLLGGHQMLESWVLNTAITGHVPYMQLQLHSQNHKQLTPGNSLGLKCSSNLLHELYLGWRLK